MKPTTSCLASFVFIWKNKAEDKLKIYEKQGNRRMKIWQKNITVTSLIKDFDNQLFYNIHDWKIKAFSNKFLVNVESQFEFQRFKYVFIFFYFYFGFLPFILLIIFFIFFLKLDLRSTHSTSVFPKN